MPEDEAYEIMPYKEIVALKKEVESLKKKSGDVSSKELIGQMASLTKSMTSMLSLFKQAADEMRAEESTEDKLAAKIDPLIEKLDAIIDQNKTIAEGMVAIADMVKESTGIHKPIRHEPAFKPKEPDFSSFGKEMPPPKEPAGLPPLGSSTPPPGPMPPGPPPGLGPMPPPSNSLPPLPPSAPPEKPKHGLFGRR